MAEETTERTKGTIAKNKRARAIAQITKIVDEQLDTDADRTTVLAFIFNEYRQFLGS